MLKKILPTLAKRNLKELTKRTSLFSISALEKKVRKNASARVKKVGKMPVRGKKAGKKSQEKCQGSGKKSGKMSALGKKVKTR